MKTRLGAAALALGLLPPAAFGDEIMPSDVLAVESSLADQIQKKVLDCVLGLGRASVFVRAKVEFALASSGQAKSGKGETRTVEPVAASSGAVSGQYAEQTRAEKQSSASATLGVSEMRVRVVYDDKLSKDRIEAARRTISGLFQDALKSDAQQWIPAPFGPEPR
jgi:hypothetical protein